MATVLPRPGAPPIPRPREMRLEMQVPPTVTLADVRGVVAAWAKAVHAEQGDLLIIVTELLANARDATPS
jgi:hypothetical protein